MRRASLWIVIAGIGAAAGCRRAAPPPDPPAEAASGAARDPGPLAVGPARLVGAGGLPVDVDVPAGWVVRAGTEPAERVVATLRDGVRVILAAPGTATPRELPECRWIQHDLAGRHLDVPALAPAALATCAPVEPDGATVFSWIGVVAGAPLHAEVHLGPGELVAGRDAALALLAGISASGADGASPR